MTVEQAKAMDMVDYLSSIGHAPTKITGNQYWYHSPLHDEKTPSFKINRKMNRWYDFADGKGGNLVDFGTLYHKCSVSDFLQRLNAPGLTIIRNERTPIDASLRQESGNQIKVLSSHEITSYPLLKYLRSRRIADEIAFKYLKEVRYSTGDKNYYALGFRNDAGGYELRNENFKGSSSPKDVSFFDNGAKDIAVFEGFFNFLSYENMYYNQEEPSRNFLVLNSTSFFEKSIGKMQEHHRVHLYLDNDKTGQKYTQLGLSTDKEKFKDERVLYQKYDDLNDWLVNIGKSQKQQLRLKP